MARIFGGALLVVAGIAAFIEVHAHPFVPAVQGPTENARALDILREITPPKQEPASGLSSTAHDLLLIGAWALLVFGVLIVVVGLMAYARRDAPRRDSLA